MDIEWRDIAGYQGFYEVSNTGKVRSLDRYANNRGTQVLKRGRILQPAKTDSGHLYVQLHKFGSGRHRKIHRLVLEAFVSPCPDGMEACHNDGDPKNNHLANLRWDTRSNNTLDAVRHRTHPWATKTHCPQGHPYSDENTFIRRCGGRVCLICNRLRDARRRENARGAP